MIRYRFRELLAEKERQEGRRIPLREISEATEVGVGVLSSLGSPQRRIVTNTRYLEAVCRYFGCGIEELVAFTPEIGQEASCRVSELYPEEE